MLSICSKYLDCCNCKYLFYYSDLVALHVMCVCWTYVGRTRRGLGEFVHSLANEMRDVNTYALRFGCGEHVSTYVPVLIKRLS